MTRDPHPADPHSPAADPAAADLADAGSASRYSRRGVIAAAGVGAVVGAAATAVGTRALDTAGHGGGGGAHGRGGGRGDGGVGKGEDVVAFYGPHQAGITTAQQEHLHTCAFRVRTSRAEALRSLLNEWSEMAARMTAGEVLGGVEGAGGHGADTAIPTDSGETLDLPPAELTLTIGYAPSLFDGRFGLADRRPAHLEPLPTFPGDQLIEEYCTGDIVVQACAQDPQVAVHAIRNLARVGTGLVEVVWSQLGYGRASSTTEAQTTPRNLFGYKDGTRNLRAEDTAEVDSFVWSDEPGMMEGGSYMCIRRVRMLLEIWDRQTLGDQDATFGRQKLSGAPLGAQEEFDEVPFDLTIGREPAVPRTSHVFLAHPEQHGGVRMLRRSYNFVEGSDHVGHIAAGLFFVAFVADPAQHFVPIQMSLSRHDKMNEYVRYESAMVAACPRGLEEGQGWGDQLFGT